MAHNCSWPSCSCDPEGIESPPCRAEHANEQAAFTEKTRRNARVQSRYDALMAEGKHGHYETMFRVVHEEVEAAQTDAYAEGRRDEAADWNNVGPNGPPPCDGETVFVGINTAGFSCCFNEATHDGVCSMQGPELCTVQMSGLEWWRVLSRPPESA